MTCLNLTITEFSYPTITYTSLSPSSESLSVSLHWQKEYSQKSLHPCSDAFIIAGCFNHTTSVFSIMIEASFHFQLSNPISMSVCTPQVICSFTWWTWAGREIHVKVSYGLEESTVIVSLCPNWLHPITGFTQTGSWTRSISSLTHHLERIIIPYQRGGWWPYSRGQEL